ncbi:MAG: hypothetical protein J2P24_08245 [Streptosporangiales bacterium]|nr:hypothetical protein [Streptosporangiales bacterium]
MEALIFAALIATLITRKGLADIPFMVRGKTPPSHERRMAEMRAREANRERRHMRRVARSTRPRGAARSYASALWQHSWEQAAQRRRVRWEHRDPVKAQAYAEKMREKADGTYRSPVRRAVDKGRDLHAMARRVARADAADYTPERHPTEDVSAAASPVPQGAAAETTPEAAPAETGSDAELAPNQYDPDTSNSTPERGNTMSVLSSEAVGLEAFQAALDEHIAAAQGGPGSLDGLLGSAQQQELGPQVTGGLSKAAEGYQLVEAGLQEAKEGLQDSVNVGESYASNPNAGDKDFVTH